MARSLLLSMLILSLSSYGDSLDDAVQHGMLSNPDVLLNTAKSLSAAQAVDKAKGAYWPSVDANAGVGREESETPTTIALEGEGKRILNRIEKSIELKQNIFAGGSIAFELKRNQYVFQAQKWKTQGVAEDLALDIVNNYFKVLLNEKLYAFSVDNLKAHRSVFSMIKDRSEAGISREADLDQATARLALAESNKIAAETELRESRITYAKVVGKWPNHLKWPKVPSSNQLPGNLTEMLEMGLENHPSLKSTYADIKEAKSQYVVANAALYPKVDLVLSASKNRNMDGLVGPNNDKLAIVRMSYNLFRGGSDEANIRETAYQVQEAYEIKNRAIIDLKETMRLSWNAWIMSGLRLKPLKMHVKAAYKTRGAYREQFKVGKRTLLDLLDSQNEYYQSQIAYARGKNEETFSRYRILNGMGQLLCYLKMKLPLNVKNNDIFTSAQKHILLEKPMQGVPYPDNSNNPARLSYPVPSEDEVTLTKNIIDINATPPIQIIAKSWYVQVKELTNAATAKELTKSLIDKGFNAFYCAFKNHLYYVFTGPFEYRGQAANAMERLKENIHIEGSLVTFKDDD